MTCHKCQYQAQIDALRKRCLACNAAESDGGTPHNRVKADEYTINSAAKAVDYTRQASSPVTTLPQAIEHRFRMVASDIVALDPLDLLLVQHLMRGGSLEGYGQLLRQLAGQISGYKGRSRAMAWARKERIVAKIPLLASVLSNKREVGGEHGRGEAV